MASPAGRFSFRIIFIFLAAIFYIFLTCNKSSSTGVSRPKMETKTRRMPFSSSIDSMEPKKSAKGPSVILTASPREKLALYLGAPIWANCIMATTSVGERGVGVLPVPTKPVMPGVVRTTSQESSSMIILTSKYPGKIFSLIVDFLPCLMRILSWVGINSSKILSVWPRVVARWRRVSATRASWPE